VSQQPAIERKPRPQRRRRLWVAGGVVVVVAVVVAIILAVVLRHGNANNTSGSDNGTGDATEVTSPYDLHELSADTGPGDVSKASLVSISLPSGDGTSKYYGLSSGTEPANALIEAVAKAKEVEAGDLATTTTQQGGSSTRASTGATLTFLFPDRTTLSFDMYVQQGIIARGGRFWRVDGELSALVEAAVTAHPTK
jgi:hypothetical protein